MGFIRRDEAEAIAPVLHGTFSVEDATVSRSLLLSFPFRVLLSLQAPRRTGVPLMGFAFSSSRNRTVRQQNQRFVINLTIEERIVGPGLSFAARTCSIRRCSPIAIVMALFPRSEDRSRCGGAERGPSAYLPVANQMAFGHRPSREFFAI